METALLDFEHLANEEARRKLLVEAKRMRGRSECLSKRHVIFLVAIQRPYVGAQFDLSPNVQTDLR